MIERCKAQRTADPPQDCDWPWCGCDPAADRVITAIQESDFAMLPMTKLREDITSAIKIGAPGLSDIIIGAIVNSAMRRVQRGGHDQ